MMLCNEALCTGCEACRNACDQGALRMEESAEGFLRPVVDAKRCTDCGACATACPVLNKPALERMPSPGAYACWHADDQVRRRSSSGGAFSALAEAVLDAGGGVWGAAYDARLHVRHVEVREREGLDRLRRSKYVQSRIGDAFREVRGFLRTGGTALFVGAPCQVAGLHAFLGRDDERLVTCDFLCHGVPSPGVLARYVRWLEARSGAPLTDLNFRDKRKGWEDPSSVAELEGGRERVLYGKENHFFNGFIENVFLRESCYACAFNGLPRWGDLTLGDFWGIGNHFPFPHASQKAEGISLVLVNSARGQARLDRCADRLTRVERPLQEVVEGNAPLHTPSRRPASRDAFFLDLDAVPHDALIRRYLTPPLRRRIRIWAREHFGGTTLRLLRSAYGKMRR